MPNSVACLLPVLVAVASSAQELGDRCFRDSDCPGRASCETYSRLSNRRVCCARGRVCAPKPRDDAPWDGAAPVEDAPADETEAPETAAPPTNAPAAYRTVKCLRGRHAGCGYCWLTEELAATCPDFFCSPDTPYAGCDSCFATPGEVLTCKCPRSKPHRGCRSCFRTLSARASCTGPTMGIEV